MEVTRNYFVYWVISKWNAIPRNVINCLSLDAFKLNLGKHYICLALSQPATLATN
jgi:hypothetical protein